jgi:hypothetical protein
MILARSRNLAAEHIDYSLYYHHMHMTSLLIELQAQIIEYGKPMVAPKVALQALPMQMFRFNQWYIQVSNDGKIVMGRLSFTVRISSAGKQYSSWTLKMCLRYTIEIPSTFL